MLAYVQPEFFFLSVSSKIPLSVGSQWWNST